MFGSALLVSAKGEDDYLKASQLMAIEGAKLQAASVMEVFEMFRRSFKYHSTYKINFKTDIQRINAKIKEY